VSETGVNLLYRRLRVAAFSTEKAHALRRLSLHFGSMLRRKEFL